MSTIPVGYKQTEVGVIPEEWEAIYLEKVCGHITTGKLDANVQNEFGEYPFFTCAKEVYRINKYAFDDEALLVSGNGAHVGYVHYYKGKFNAYQRTYVLSDFRASINYIKQFLQIRLCDRLRVEVNAGNTPYIVRNTLSKMSIPLPPLPEQKRIAQVLGDVDALIQKLEALIAKKRDIKQAAMQELLTGKRRLPGFSGAWETKRLGEVFSILAGGDLKFQSFSPLQDEKHRFPIYSNSLSSFGIYGFTSEAIYPAESITVTARGTIGHAEYRSTRFDAIGRVLVLIGKLPSAPSFFASLINERLLFVSESTGVP